MKSVIALVFLSFGFISAAQANEAALACEGQARQYAQAILDIKAQAYGFDSSTIGDIVQTNGEDFTFESYVYKATYNVTVNLDSGCDYLASSIEEVLSPEDRAAAEQE